MFVKCLAQGRWPLNAAPTSLLPTLVEMRAGEAECPVGKGAALRCIVGLGQNPALPLCALGQGVNLCACFLSCERDE